MPALVSFLDELFYDENGALVVGSMYSWLCAQPWVTRKVYLDAAQRAHFWASSIIALESNPGETS